MGDIRINLGNFVSVGLIAFVFIFAVNRALAHFNLQKYEA